jgi:hypothetical protein
MTYGVMRAMTFSPEEANTVERSTVWASLVVPAES